MALEILPGLTRSKMKEANPDNILDHLEEVALNLDQKYRPGVIDAGITVYEAQGASPLRIVRFIKESLGID